MTNKITSKQVLGWARTVKSQKVQKALIKATKQNKDFDIMKKQEQKNNTFYVTKADRREMCIKCKYCRCTHKPQRCRAYGRSCSGYNKLNHFEEEPEKAEVKGWQ